MIVYENIFWGNIIIFPENILYSFRKQDGIPQERRCAETTQFTERKVRGNDEHLEEKYFHVPGHCDGSWHAPR